MKLAISILTSNYDTKTTIDNINKTNADLFHIDVMDGIFTNKCFDPFEYLKYCNKPLNVHLMVNNPFEYISKYKLLNPEYIIFHSEVDDDIDSLIDYVKENNIKVGLALKPSTSIKSILEYIDKLDEILIMTVEIGEGGQKLLDYTLHKVKELIKLRDSRGLNFEIGVDGGINNETIKKVLNTNIITVGSYITKSDNYQERINNLL